MRSIIHSYQLYMITYILSIMILGFRLLTEYYSFLYGKTLKLNRREKVRTFPSPYGVSLILIDKILLDIETNTLPCFRLLTEYHSFLSTYLIFSFYWFKFFFVSVSLRSIIHSYIISINFLKFSLDTLVSVSLRSIIHSYSKIVNNITIDVIN